MEMKNLGNFIETSCAPVCLCVKWQWAITVLISLVHCENSVEEAKYVRILGTQHSRVLGTVSTISKC